MKNASYHLTKERQASRFSFMNCVSLTPVSCKRYFHNLKKDVASPKDCPSGGGGAGLSLSWSLPSGKRSMNPSSKLDMSVAVAADMAVCPVPGMHSLF